MRISIVIVLTMISWLFLTAQPEPPTGHVTNILGLMGIEEEKLNDIKEDWNGFIWLARNDGLYRYDGTTLKHYTQSGGPGGLPHNEVLNILIDHERQELWLGTSLGLCRLDPVTEKTITYQFDFSNPNSLADNVVAYVFKDSDGRIWVGCYNHGLSLFRDETDDFQNFYFEIPKIDSLQIVHPNLNESRVNSFKFIIEDNQNKNLLWLGTPLGLVGFDKRSGSFRWPFMEKPSEDDYLMKSVNFIYPFEDQLLVGTWGSAYVFNIGPGTIELIRPDVEKNSDFEYVTNIYRTTEGKMWISYSKGLVSYDMESGQIEKAWADIPELNQYRGIRLVDSGGRFWIRSSQTTVLYDPLKQITENFVTEKVIFRQPHVFKKWEEGQLVLLTSQPDQYHIFDLATQRWQSFSFITDDIDWEEILWNDILKMDSHHWLLLDKTHLYTLDTRTHRLQILELDTGNELPYFTKGLIDSQGFLWLATQRIGLFRVNLATGEKQHFIDELNSPSSSSLYTWITDLHMDREGHIWVRLARSYAIYDPDTGKFQVFSHHQYPHRTFRYIQNFAESANGTVWIASMDEGFGRTDARNLEAGIIERFSADEGLLSNQILQMEFGKDAELLILSKKGLTVFDTEKRSIQNVTWDWGIPRSALFVPLSDNRIAFAMEQGGIGILSQEKILSRRAIPRPYITQVNVDGKAVYRSGNRISLNEIEIHSGRDNLFFEFSAMSYSSPKQFAYQLEGYSNQWNETAGLRSASYSNLSPGDYTFRLKVRQFGGEWSEETVLNVFLVPRWWETGWFKGALLALLLFLGYRAYRWRLEEAKRKERVKAAFQRKLDEVEMQALRSQMNPHFLFNSLNSIQHYIINNKSQEAIEYLDRFSRLVRLILQNSRSKLVPLADELEALQLYMELESLRFKVKFDHIIEVDPSINPGELEIPPMLMQPFVENAIWHGIQHKGEKGTVLIKIERAGEQLICTIEDDGIGREATAKLKINSKRGHRSMGLKITQDRLEMINHSRNGVATVEVIDLYDQANQATGTRVVFRLPL